MTTNKPGIVTQRPLFGCTSCYEDVSYPADDLRVYNGECWCEMCWEEATHEIADGIDWLELEPFKPALYSQDREDAERYRWLRENWFTMGSTYKDDQIQFYINGPRYSNATEAELDEAIDHARRAKGGGE